MKMKTQSKVFVLYVAVSTFLILCISPSCVIAASDTPKLHSININRRPVPASRVYAFGRRPWFNRYSHLLDAPHITTAAGLPENVSSTRDIYSTPLHGSITRLGEYFVTLTFGGQRINVQLDTGSSTMAVPLRQCINCVKGDHRLDLDSAVGRAGIISCSSRVCQPESCVQSCGACSKTQACCSQHYPKGCSFSLRYADRSGVNGVLVLAEVGISSLFTPLVFGAILEQDSFEATEVDGIFGLAYKYLACNPSCITPLFDTLVASGKVSRDVFSLCTGREGGVLTLGGSVPTLYEGELSYVSMRNYSYMMFYMVGISGTSIGGKNVHLPHFSNGIVDSGTTLLIVSQRTYDALRVYFQSNYCNVPGLCPQSDSREIVPHPYYPHPSSTEEDIVSSSTKQSANREATWFTPGYCVALPEKYLDLLPVISIHLRGYTLDIGPRVYMIPHYIQHGLTKKLYYCLGIAPLAGLERLPNDVIIGDTVLQKYFVEYDRENNRLGFAVAKNCYDPSAVEPDPRSINSHGKENSGGFFSWLSNVPIIFWIIFIVGIILLVLNCVKRSGYRPISSQQG